MPTDSSPCPASTGVIVGSSSTATCNDGATELQRAAVWTDGRAADLNRQLVGRHGIVLLDLLIPVD